MLNQQKSVGYGFSLFPRLIGFVFVGKLALAGAVFRTLVLWCWKFRAFASINFRASARLGRLAQSEISFNFLVVKV
ncbi:hypothetical protein NMS78_003490 [Vibrio cholerae]|nr:hypothetical protein [Vibrio cholerae]BCK25979.1 hypothetical protein VCSRO63_2919 [Vibrio cholerae]